MGRGRQMVQDVPGQAAVLAGGLSGAPFRLTALASLVNEMRNESEPGEKVGNALIDASLMKVADVIEPAVRAVRGAPLVKELKNLSKHISRTTGLNDRAIKDIATNNPIDVAFLSPDTAKATIKAAKQYENGLNAIYNSAAKQAARVRSIPGADKFTYHTRVDTPVVDAKGLYDDFAAKLDKLQDMIVQKEGDKALIQYMRQPVPREYTNEVGLSGVDYMNKSLGDMAKDLATLHKESKIGYYNNIETQKPSLFGAKVPTDVASQKTGAQRAIENAGVVKGVPVSKLGVINKVRKVLSELGMTPDDKVARDLMEYLSKQGHAPESLLGMSTEALRALIANALRVKGVDNQ